MQKVDFCLSLGGTHDLNEELSRHRGKEECENVSHVL